MSSVSGEGAGSSGATNFSHFVSELKSSLSEGSLWRGKVQLLDGSVHLDVQKKSLFSRCSKLSKRLSKTYQEKKQSKIKELVNRAVQLSLEKEEGGLTLEQAKAVQALAQRIFVGSADKAKEQFLRFEEELPHALAGHMSVSTSVEEVDEEEELKEKGEVGSQLVSEEEEGAAAGSSVGTKSVEEVEVEVAASASDDDEQVVQHDMGALRVFQKRVRTYAEEHVLEETMDPERYKSLQEAGEDPSHYCGAFALDLEVGGLEKEPVYFTPEDAAVLERIKERIGRGESDFSKKEWVLISKFHHMDLGEGWYNTHISQKDFGMVMCSKEVQRAVIEKNEHDLEQLFNELAGRTGAGVLGKRISKNPMKELYKRFSEAASRGEQKEFFTSLSAKDKKRLAVIVANADRIYNHEIQVGVYNYNRRRLGEKEDIETSSKVLQMALLLASFQSFTENPSALEDAELASCVKEIQTLALEEKIEMKREALDAKIKALPAERRAEIKALSAQFRAAGEHPIARAHILQSSPSFMADVIMLEKEISEINALGRELKKMGAGVERFEEMMASSSYKDFYAGHSTMMRTFKEVDSILDKRSAESFKTAVEMRVSARSLSLYIGKYFTMGYLQNVIEETIFQGLSRAHEALLEPETVRSVATSSLKALTNNFKSRGEEEKVGKATLALRKEAVLTGLSEALLELAFPDGIDKALEEGITAYHDRQKEGMQRGRSEGKTSFLRRAKVQILGGVKEQSLRVAASLADTEASGNTLRHLTGMPIDEERPLESLLQESLKLVLGSAVETFRQPDRICDAVLPLLPDPDAELEEGEGVTDSDDAAVKESEEDKEVVGSFVRSFVGLGFPRSAGVLEFSADLFLGTRSMGASVIRRNASLDEEKARNLLGSIRTLLYDPEGFREYPGAKEKNEAEKRRSVALFQQRALRLVRVSIKGKEEEKPAATTVENQEEAGGFWAGAVGIASAIASAGKNVVLEGTTRYVQSGVLQAIEEFEDEEKNEALLVELLEGIFEGVSEVSERRHSGS